jgi:lysozyme family protein
MSADPFTTALAFIWRPENDGQGFHDDPRDPGGATSWGATYATYTAWLAMHKLSMSLAAFKVLPQSAFTPFYRALFWQACRCDELPPGVAVSVFDAAVGSAPAHAIKFLQTAAGAVADGVFGPMTMAVVKGHAPDDLIRSMWLLRDKFYADLPTFRIYGRGWDRRAADCEALSLSFVAP